MTDFLLAVLIALVLVLLFRAGRENEHGENAAEPAKEPEAPLPMEICRKARPSIEEQIINLALYNGEDQKGGEG